MFPSPFPPFSLQPEVYAPANVPKFKKLTATSLPSYTYSMVALLWDNSDVLKDHSQPNSLLKQQESIADILNVLNR